MWHLIAAVSVIFCYSILWQCNIPPTDKWLGSTILLYIIHFLCRSISIFFSFEQKFTFYLQNCRNCYRFIQSTQTHTIKLPIFCSFLFLFVVFLSLISSIHNKINMNSFVCLGGFRLKIEHRFDLTDRLWARLLSTIRSGTSLWTDDKRNDKRKKEFSVVWCLYDLFNRNNFKPFANFLTLNFFSYQVCALHMLQIDLVQRPLSANSI